MKIRRLIIVALMAANSFADSVRWGGATFSKSEVSDPETHEFVDGTTLVWKSPEDGHGNYEQPGYYLHGVFSVTRTGNSTTIKGVNHVAAFSTVFVQMDVGDSVDLLTTFYADEVFYAFGWRPGEEEIAGNHRYSGDYDITVSGSGTQVFFLGFGVEGSTTDTDSPEGFSQIWLYGWLEVAVDGTELSVVNSAIGLNGQSMTVGLIPEPTTTMLLLLGLASLALRRRLTPSAPIV